MSAVQRSKRGCWTCRLRRKKCSEGGVPCQDCAARNIFCHGYGPKPSWKDRGGKEREEAMRLQLQSRSRRGQPSSSNRCASAPTSSSSDGNTPDRQSLMVTDFSMMNEPLQDISFDHSQFEFVDPQDLENMVASNKQLSIDYAGTDLDQFLNLSIPILDPTTVQATSMTLTNFDESWINASNPPSESPLETSRHPPPVRDPKTPNLPYIPFGGARARAPQISEKEIELIVTFLIEMYPVERNSRWQSPTSQSSWLLFLLINSPTFYFASLSMSAFHSSRSPETTSEARAVSSREYREYRAKALQSFEELNENSAGTVGEMLICGVQIARLEALSHNAEAYRSYLNSAVRYLATHEDIFLRNPDPAPNVLLSPIIPTGPNLHITTTIPTPHPTPMQSKALTYFATLLFYNDILSCSICKRPVADTYRKLLSDQNFTSSFQDITGYDTWILSAIMEATNLEVWKRDQQSLSQLSIRELVIRSDKIEAIVENGINSLSNILGLTAALASPGSTRDKKHAGSSQIQAYIFAHAILIELHGIVSGPRPNVPEINRNIERAIAAWKMLPSSMSPKALAWPYCVSASLASGPQRAFFREIGSRGSLDDTALGRFPELKVVVEECWREYDERGADCDTAADWKDVLQKSNLSIVFW